MTSSPPDTPVLLARYAGGIILASPAPRGHLPRAHEIHDRIALAAVGPWDQCDALRVAGIRHCDLTAYTYDRQDVHASTLATVYARTLGSARRMGPGYDVTLAVAELGPVPSADVILTIEADGAVSLGVDPVLIGAGEADDGDLPGLLESLTTPLDLATTISLARTTLGPLDVAVLDRQTDRRRTFRRLSLDPTDRTHP